MSGFEEKLDAEIRRIEKMREFLTAPYQKDERARLGNYLQGLTKAKQLLNHA